MSQQLPLFQAPAERDAALLERDKNRFLIGLPPLSEEGKAWAEQYTTDQRTTVCRHKPNRAININD